jgi:DUF4097 and DUF4098 domain-containing protein YvlB
MVAIVTAWTLPAIAQEDIDITRELSDDGKVSIENISGSVIVSAWDRNEVHIEGTLGEGTKRLDVDGNKKRLKIEVILPKRVRSVKASHLIIHIPVGAELAISTISADIEVTGLAGEISLESVSGQIDVKADPTKIEVESVSGDLDLRVTSLDVDLECISGDINLETKNLQSLSIDAISGDVEILAILVDRFDFESISGDLDFKGWISERGRLSSHSGDLVLVLGGNIDAEFEISTFSGDIRNAFGPKAQRSNRFNITQELEFTIGDGSTSIDIESFSGDIVLKKK